MVTIALREQGMARVVALLCLVAALLAGCQAGRDPQPAPEPAPQPPPVVPNLRVELEHGNCAGPPCPVGVAEDLASGERVTIFDYDLTPLGLPDEDRMRLTQAMFVDSYLVRGAIEQRVGFLAVDRPVEVLVVDAIAGPA
jgi:hypothetical protein